MEKPSRELNSKSWIMPLPDEVRQVIDTLESAGHEAWVVGGCVRDALLGHVPQDYDITTSAKPQEVQELFEKTIPTGIKHGTVTVMINHQPLEVTTYRVEEDYKDHRHPEQVRFVSNIDEDLARRDFTINAMAWHPQRGLRDPFGGQKDLEAGIIRAVGDPYLRFEEDALRMFRAWRFAGRFGFDLDPETEKAIEHCTPYARGLSAERVRAETEKIMKDSPRILDHLTRLLQFWIPQLEQMRQAEQNSPYHYTDVWHHTLDALCTLDEWDPTVYWAVLLHDSGKPKVKTTDNGRDHFKRHEIASAKIAAGVFNRMHFPKKMAKDAVKLIEKHDAFYAPRLNSLYKLRVKAGFDDELVEKLFRVQQADILAHAIQDRQQQLNTFKAFYEKEKTQVPLSVGELKVNGQDAMELTELPKASIGHALQNVLQTVICHPQWNTRESQIKLLKQTAEQMEKETEENKEKKEKQ